MKLREQLRFLPREQKDKNLVKDAIVSDIFLNNALDDTQAWHEAFCIVSFFEDLEDEHLNHIPNDFCNYKKSNLTKHAH